MIIENSEKNNAVRFGIIIRTIFTVLFLLTLACCNDNKVLAEEVELEKLTIDTIKDFQDENYTYSYHQWFYYMLVNGEYMSGNVAGHRRFLLDCTNADEININLRSAFYNNHRSSCSLKETLTVNPVKITVNIGNGKLVKKYEVEQTRSERGTLPIPGKSVTLTLSNLAKYNFGEEIVDISWNDEGISKCSDCGYVIRKGIAIEYFYVTDYRGTCSFLTNTDSADNGVTVNAEVDEYTNSCEWHVRFEGDSSELVLHDGIMENGMYVMGALTNHLTLQNIPADKGKVMTVLLYTKDVHGQGLTGLSNNESPYSKDIYIANAFRTGMNDIVARTGQTVCIDLAKKIPPDTYGIKWQQSQDGKNFSDSFQTSIFSNRVSGVNNATLKINGALGSMNGYSFRCVCSDEYGRESISDNVKLYVVEPVFYYNNIPITNVYINGKKLQ